MHTSIILLGISLIGMTAARRPHGTPCAATPGKHSRLAVAKTMATLIIALLLPAGAFAQNTSHWGVGASVTPQWSNSDRLRSLGETTWGINPDATVTLEGSEFTVGIVRGSSGGGDWGVSFVRKSVNDGSQFLEAQDSEPCTPSDCFRTTSTVTTEAVRLQGVEFHWSRPFFTVADRVQVGVNVAGGVATVKGQATQTYVMESTFDLPGFPRQREVFVDTFSGPIGEHTVIYSTVPLLKLEAQVAVRVAPGLKLKVQGGVNMPSIGVRVGAVYLFGAE